MCLLYIDEGRLCCNPVPNVAALGLKKYGGRRWRGVRVHGLPHVCVLPVPVEMSWQGNPYTRSCQFKKKSFLII